jgi:hypothetical protein
MLPAIRGKALATARTALMCAADELDRLSDSDWRQVGQR